MAEDPPRDAELENAAVPEERMASQPKEADNEAMDVEQKAASDDSTMIASEDEGGGDFVLDAQAAGADADANLKTTRDGRTYLVPQPSDDPKDPLNWSWTRKHVILFTISIAAFLPDYGTSIGAVTLIPQSMEWHTTQDGMLRSLVGNLFMEGAAGPFIVALMAYFGRLPVLFWFLVFALWTAAMCAASPTLDVFIAARTLGGTFATVAQAGGLIFINDIFFVHEHARKINIWSFFIILSPYLGPLITAFIISEYSWRWSFWLFTLITGLALVLAALFGEETFYNRKIAADQQPPRRSRVLRLVGVAQWQSRHQRNTVSEAAARPIKAIAKPVVFIISVYYMLIFSWVVGANTTLSIFLQPLYGFGPRQIGFFYFTPIIATVLGEVSGHFVHDMVAAFSMRRNGGHLHAEARLIVLHLAMPVMVAGLVLLGFALQNAYHYMIVALGWGLYVFGIMVATVGVNAYVLTAYPDGAGEVAAWLNFTRILGGFIITYVQVRWAAAAGPQRSFGVQAAIVAAATLLVIVLQVFGARLRKWSGPLGFKTN